MGGEKCFVVKKEVKGGACGGVRLHWLEWDCLGESRSVMGNQTVPRGRGQPRCGLLGEVL